MRHYKKMITLMAACFALCVFCFVGCAEQEKVYVPVTSNTVEVTEDGRLIGYLVEEFDKAYYDINELKEMVIAEIDVYNKENADLSTEAGRAPIVVEKVMMAEDGSAKAVVALNFQSAAAYEDYMGKEVFYGTVSEALEAGYELDGVLIKVKNGEALTGEKLEKNSKKNILIVEDCVQVRTYNQVQYLSANATMTPEGNVDASAAEELKYIMTK